MIGYNIIHLLPVFAVEQLQRVFNSFLREGRFPEEMETLVIFIPKVEGGGVHPISLTSRLLKLLEKCIYSRLRWYIESSAIIPNFQFGFNNFRSC